MMRRVLLLLLVAALLPGVLAANPGHLASSISPGTFGAGNFYFVNDLGVNGSTFFVNSTSGFVGIGTTAPQSALEVVGTFNVSGNAQFKDDVYFSNTFENTGIFFPAGSRVYEQQDGFSRLTLESGSSQIEVRDNLMLAGTSPQYVGQISGPQLLFDDASDYLFVGNNLNGFGIGTSTPTQLLDVNGSINISDASGALYAPEICLNGDCQTAWPSGGASDGTGGWTNNSENTTTSLRVGIGTATPNATLEVNGSVRVTPGTGMTALGSVPSLYGSGSFVLYDAVPVGDYLYVADGWFNWSIWDVNDKNNPRFVSMTSINGARGLEVVGSTLYSHSNAFDLRSYDISDPTSPALLDTFSLPGTYVTSKVQSYGAYTYLWASNSTHYRLVILDTSDPSDITEVGSYEAVGGTEGRLTHIWIENDLAYVTTGYGLQIINVSDPANPTNISLYAPISWLVDVEVYGAVAFAGGWGHDRVYALNVSDPYNVSVLDELSVPTNVIGVEKAGDYLYTISEDGNATYVVDVRDPANLVLADTVSLAGSPYQLSVQGRYAYVTTPEEVVIYEIPSIVAPAAEIGSLEVDALAVNNEVRVAGRAIVDNGLAVGRQGIQTQGDILGRNLSVSDNLIVGGNANVSGVLRAPEICLNGDCQTSWPSGGGGGSGGWTNNSENTTTSLRVGIGTTTPTHELQVNGSANITGTLFASNVSSNSPLQLQTSGTTRIFVNDTNGNVGIGTTDPAQKLTVNGTLRASSLSLDSALGLAQGGTGATDAAGARTSLGATTVGNNLFTLPNPGAVRFMTINADNTVTAESASDFRSSIGAIGGSGGINQVAVFTGSGFQISSENQLTWDFNNNRLGIGISSPTETLDVGGNLQLTGSLLAPSDAEMQNVTVFTEQTSALGSESLRRVAYGNGTFVAVSNGGRIATSTDGESWTMTFDSAPGWLNGVAYGDGIWVAVGQLGALYNSSTNGASWSTQTSSFGTTRINNVVYGNGTWVAVGDSGSLATSSDAISWTQRTSSFASSNINNVDYFNGTFIAVGDDGTIATSRNGTNWTQESHPLSGSAQFWDVSYGDGLWVVVNSWGQLATSPNGTTWTSRTSSFGSSVILAVDYNPTQGLWTAVGRDSKAATSVDGINWNAETANVGSTPMNSIANDNSSRWVIVGDTGLIRTTDGLEYLRSGTILGSSTNTLANVFAGALTLSTVNDTRPEVVFDDEKIISTDNTSITFNSNISVDGDVNATGSLRAPEICLNGDCQTSWPTGGGGGSDGTGGWTNNSENTTTTLSVGIGTASPNATLDVNGTVNVEDNISIGAGKFIFLGNNNAIITEASGQISIASGNSANIYLGPSSNLVSIGGSIRLGGPDPQRIETSQAASGPQFFLNDNTNTLYASGTLTGFGIGTATPTQMLDVNGSTNISANLSVDGNTLFVNSDTGRVGIGTNTPGEALAVDGNINATGTVTGGAGIDIAEMFRVSEPLEGGLLVAAVDGDTVVPATRANAEQLVGVVSTQPGMVLGAPHLRNYTTSKIALAGRVPVQIEGTAQPGDYITVSDTPGIGRVATEPGFVVGRVLGPSVLGDVIILVEPGYYSPQADRNGRLIGAANKRVEPTALVSGQGASNEDLSLEMQTLREELERLRSLQNGPRQEFGIVDGQPLVIQI